MIHIKERVKNPNWADRWFADTIDCLKSGGFSLSCEIDMTQAAALLKNLRKDAYKSVKLTYTHLFVWALGKAVAKHPELNVVSKGYRHIYPNRVNISLSVASETFLAPVMVIKDVEKKSLIDLAQEITSRVPIIKAKDQKMIDNLRKFGWLVPFKFLRHLIIKYWFRTRESGTFQLTCVPTVDVVAPYIFSASAIFGIGQVKERQNTETIDRRLSVNVTLVVNHAIFDGQRASILLNEFKNVLEKIENYYQQT